MLTSHHRVPPLEGPTRKSVGCDAVYALLDGFMPAQEIRSLIRSIHMGTWGGLFSRILTCLAALIGGILPLTGYYIWLKRVGKKRRTK